MIHLLIGWLGAVLVDDHGHETLSTFAYILLGLLTLFWVIALAQARPPIPEAEK